MIKDIIRNKIKKVNHNEYGAYLTDYELTVLCMSLKNLTDYQIQQKEVSVQNRKKGISNSNWFYFTTNQIKNNNGDIL